MREDWCHNCRHFLELIDGVFCGYCLNYFYDHGRLPGKNEKVKEGKRNG